MKLFILAAGVGSRLMPLTKDRPKSLIEFDDGTSILERQLKTAQATEGIEQVQIITGYRSIQIEEKIQSLGLSNFASVVYNPFFRISNNLMSVWCALPHINGEDFCISNGDNLYNENVFPQVLEQTATKEGIFLTLNEKPSFDDDDMKVIIEEGVIKRVHKKIAIEDTNAESVGLAIVRGTDAQRNFKSIVESIVKDEAYLDKFWLEIFNSFIDDGGSVDSVWVNKDDWREMDFHPDIDIIHQAIENKLF
ncbi:MAG: sugar phosphate nucleotidyltransferase [Bdellovibrionales bacterium]